MLWFALPWPLEKASAQPAQDEPGDPPACDPLGWWALRLTPHVARLGDALLLEVSGSLRLWGGAAALQRRIFEENPALASANIAQAAIGIIALAHLRLRRDGRGVPAGGVAALPLSVLDAARLHLPLLERLGLRTWGDAHALPRAPMVRRFGPGLRAALDVAFGLVPERYPWLVLPERFDEALELPAHAESAPALLWSANRLLAALQAWLRARQQGVLAFELGWTLDQKRLNGRALPPAQSLRIRTAEPAQSMDHLRRLLAERLARTSLLAPAIGLRLHAVQTAPWQPGNAALLPGEQRRGEPLHVFIERANARLGPGSVRRPVLRADHRPEQRQRWEVVDEKNHPHPKPLPPAGEGATDHAPADALAPTWLLHPPQPLEVRGGLPWRGGAALRLLTRPCRVETGWWAEGAPASDAAGEAVARDYFMAQGAAQELLWVYRERPTSRTPASAAPRWFLHGIYA